MRVGAGMRLKQISSIKKHQKGSFMIELLFVVIALWGIYLFSTDLSKQLLLRGKLDRSSFALVNVLKERTRYFNANISRGLKLEVSQRDLENLQKVASRMLNVAEDNVAIQIESLTNKTSTIKFTSGQFLALNCSSKPLIERKTLAPVEKSIIYPLYQVSLCIEHKSWFAPFFNGGVDTRLKIQSSSIMPGR